MKNKNLYDVVQKTYLDGLNYISFSKRLKWEKTVEQFYSKQQNKDIEKALKIIKIINEKNDFNEGIKILNEIDSNTSFKNVYNVVLLFSQKGADFANFLAENFNQKDLKSKKIIDKIKKEQDFEFNLTNDVATKLHDDWRKTRLNKDGFYEPRWKTIKDEKFINSLDVNNLPSNIRKSESGFEIDIANSTYSQLSLDWKKENYEAAKVVAGLYVIKEILKIPLSLAKIGEIIHEEWLNRNPWGKEDPKLSLPFAYLSYEEQDKDLNQYLLAKQCANNIKAYDSRKEM